MTLFLRDGDMTFAASGDLDPRNNTAPDRALFEIGSITKVFTALLLAVLVEEGRIDPDRPIRDLVSGLSDAPPWITPRNLATHTSGLPTIHMPLWKAVFCLPDDPYAAFSRRDLIDWLRIRGSTAPPRRQLHRYSNLGYGLLGEAMAMREGKPFSDLLAEKVLTPLGLTDTTADLTTAQQARFMQPFNVKDRPVVPWSFQAIAGAGCLRSTARDLGQFSSAVLKALAHPESALDRAICRSALPLVGLGPNGAHAPVTQCLGWLSIKLDREAPRMLFHNGGTAGSTCALYICPAANASALILSNRGVAAGMWSSAKWRRSDPDRAMSDVFASLSSSANATPSA
ncbi:beta-lactamase family protein [Rhodobacteraceae bacterium N5(2021)]|uniref:Beta-lactamase family protein n=1 Tax=Gymnodinialimonas phycosphaerae TaxID=2841589 RepID=A0A975TXT2_9RHOB|nr:beta-lactamase family protein [Gymnodinialimonas phycosphaerae]